MIEPIIGKGISLGKPQVPDERSKRLERLYARTRAGGDVAAYQRRVLGRLRIST